MNGKRYVLVRYCSNVDIACPSGASIVFTSQYDKLQSDKPRLNRVVLRFSKCKDASLYATNYYCERFKTVEAAKAHAGYYSPEVLRQHFGEEKPIP